MTLKRVKKLQKRTAFILSAFDLTITTFISTTPISITHSNTPSKVTHSFGDVMQVKLIQPTPQEMFELPNVDAADDFGGEKPVANVKFSMSVHWFPHAEYDMTR